MNRTIAWYDEGVFCIAYVTLESSLLSNSYGK